MSTEAVKTIIGRAVAEEAYRELLFTNPDQALAGFDLTEEETATLKGLKREEFDAAAGDLEQRISKSFIGLAVDHKLEPARPPILTRGTDFLKLG